MSVNKRFHEGSFGVYVRNQTCYQRLCCCNCLTFLHVKVTTVFQLFLLVYLYDNFCSNHVQITMWRISFT